MRLLPAATFLTPFAVAFAVDAAPLPSPEQVDIPLGNGILHAQLYKPDGDGPFPTVIALHGCGGLTGHSEPVLPRYRDWAEQLLKDGQAVLLPDSYGSRELGPQCRVKERTVRGRRERVEDVAAARKWLLQQSWVARDRISLIGWAGGAPAVPDARYRAGFSFGHRLLSGLPRLRRPRLERASADPDPDRRQGRRRVGAGLPPDDRRRARPQRLDAVRGLSRRLSRFRPRQSAVARGVRKAGSCDS